ncbi:MAG: hypothetical protein M1821_004792 [Bathelium mastoideum]|nr:MAG: hypothetical protein M1821_004792 [Bathelium mastoideum]
MDTIPKFIDQKASQVDPAWDSAQQKANKRKREAILTKTDKQISQWKVFIRHFQAATSDVDVKRYDVFSCGPEQLQRAAEAAVQKYQEKGEGWLDNPIRAAARGVSENTAAFEVLLAFIPDGEYTSIICGALTLLFNAAKRLHKLRKRIMTCLTSLLAMVKGVRTRLELYPGNSMLFTAAEDLYITILEAAEKMMMWIDEPAYKHAIGSIFRQSSYGKALEADTKDLIDKKLGTLREGLDLAFERRAMDIDENVVGVGEKVEIIIQNQQTLKSVLVADLNAVMNEWWSKHEKSKLEEKPQQPIIIVQQQNFTQQAPAPAQFYLTVTDLFDIFRVPVNKDLEDLNTARLTGSNNSMHSPEQQARAGTLMHDSRFQRWLRSS